MLHFRSPYLQAPPRNLHENRAGVMQKRGLITLVVLLVVGIPALGTAWNWWPEVGLTRAFYWLHDYVFLPIKGWTYHAPGSAGLIWWLLALILFLIWLVFYLVDESMVLSSHRDLTLALLRRPRLYGALERGARVFARRGFPPHMLMEGARISHDGVREDLARDAGDPAHLGKLTLLMTRIAPLTSSGQSVWFESLIHWQSVYLDLRAKSKAEDVDWLHQLAAYPLEAVQRPGPTFDFNYWRARMTEPAHVLTVERLVLDQLLIASVDHQKTAHFLLGVDVAALPRSERLAVVCANLTRANQARLDLLDDLRRHLEQLAFSPAARLSLDSPLEEVRQAHLPLMGRAMLYTALDLSRLRLRPEPGLAMLETYEALNTTLALFDPQSDEDKELPALVHDLHEMVAACPTPEDYQRGANLLESYQERRNAQWAGTAAARAGLVRNEDLKYAAERVAHLRVAAGPEATSGEAL